MRTCSVCGEENSERARFCQACGAALGDESSAGSRKTVTVLFCDLVDSTRLGEQLDPETLRLVLDRYFDEMRGAVERHGGTVEKFIGDAVLAVFGVPRVHEDDALRAVRAADEMRGVLPKLNAESGRGTGAELQIRVGINTGEVLVGERTADRMVTGDAVNVAARLEQAADAGEIVIGEETYRFVRDAVEVDPIGPLELKGKSERITAYRVREVVAGATGRARRLDSPMVGRRRALAVIEQASEGAVADATCYLVTVLGPAGVGKTRLVEEFLARVPAAGVYRGRCLPYGEGTTFFPVVQILKQAVDAIDPGRPDAFRERVARLLDDDEHRELIAERVAQLAGVAEVTGSEEMLWASRRFFEALARQRPIVLVLDDLQWAGRAFLDLVEHVADFSREAPILLLAMARPDLLEVRPGWGGGKLNAFTISLEPLSADECNELIDNLLGSAELEGDVRARIADAAGGTPLFVEEMVAKLIDDGLLTRSDGRWVATTDLSHVPVPTTIATLLAARIDQLPSAERAILERAAVGGEHFFAGAVRWLTEAAAASNVDDHLSSLLRKDLIRPERSSLPGEDAYRFRHALIRDAAYEAMPKQLRADLHERYARWLASAVRDGMTEQDEIVGYHLEQALRYRAELGLDVDPELTGRAVRSLVDAARRSAGRFDFLGSANLMERAAVLLPDDDPERARLMAEVGATLNRHGDSKRAEAILDAVIAQCQRSGDVVTQARARIDRMWTRHETHPARWVEEMRTDVEPLIPILEAHHDDLGLTKGLQILASAEKLEGRLGRVEPLLERALEHARRAGDRLEESEILGEFVFALPDGPTPVDQALRRLDELMRGREADLRFEAWIFGVRAMLEAMRARFDEARSLAEREETILDEFGMYWTHWWVALHQGTIEMLAGRPGAAEEAIRRRRDRFAGDEATLLWGLDSILALALLEQGRISEARELADRWADVRGDDRRTRVTWCGVLARTTAEAGDLAEAGRFAREGVAMAAATDDLNMHAASLVHLAWVLRRGGDTDGTAAAIGEALELYERKGNIAAAALVRTAFPG
jgi:class 3 adenylate cyclase/tetratricopeptide (TPR) repeat protein